MKSMFGFGCIVLTAVLAVVVLVGVVVADAATAPTTAPTSQPELDEAGLFAKITELGQDPPPVPQHGSREQYLQMILKRRAEQLSLADEFLRRFGDSPKREDVLIAKLNALFMTGMVRDNGLDALGEFLSEIRKDQAHPASPILMSEVAYWQLRCDLTTQSEKLATDPSLAPGQRMSRMREFLADSAAAFVDAYPFSEHAPELLMVLGDVMLDSRTDKATADRLSGYVQKVAKHFPGHDAIELVEAKLRQIQSIGQRFDIAFTSTDGRKIDSKALVGKVVLIDFWATWCMPCVMSMPHLKELYDKYHDQGFEILGISADHRQEDLDRYLKSNDVPWPIWFDLKEGGAFMEKWSVHQYPTYFLVDRKGMLRSTNAGADLDTFVPKLLAEGSESKTGAPTTQPASGD